MRQHLIRKPTYTTAARATIFTFGIVIAPRMALRAQTCDTIASRVGLRGFAGVPIRSLEIVTQSPVTISGLPRVVERMHASTRQTTIRRELLFAAGDPLDTLRVEESLRRLRALSYLEDVQIQARTCTDSAGVGLTVVTRDSWSTRPVVAVRSRSLALGVLETNALGTGRSIRVTAQSDVQGLGGGVAVHDPSLWRGHLDGQLGSTIYATGSAWIGVLKPRKSSIADEWIGELRGTGSHREVERGPGDSFDRVRFTLLGGHRLTSALAPHAVYLLAGAESERANIVWSPLEPVLGPSAVNRHFVGADLGVSRRATRFDTLGWVLRHDGIVDVPQGTDAEIVAGYGRDFADGRDKVHLDGWTGRIWTLQNRALVIGGLWANGFLAKQSLEAATLRSSLVGVVPATNGAWTFRVAAERLYDPDPTVRALATVDPVGALLPREARLAEGAASASIERAILLYDVGRSTELDAAPFVALARRWDPATPTDGDIGAAIIGVGLRLAPSRTPGSTLRVDVGYPVGYRMGLRAGPLFAVTFTPWLISGRQRETLQQP